MQNGTVEIVSADGLTVYKQLDEVHIQSLPHPVPIRSAAQLAPYLWPHRIRSCAGPWPRGLQPWPLPTHVEYSFNPVLSHGSYLGECVL